VARIVTAAAVLLPGNPGKTKSRPPWDLRKLRVVVSDGILPRTPIVIQIVMAHAAKLGVLTDELVTLLTATSAKVSLGRFVSWILERDKRKTFFHCYTKAWANANTI
jgi:hypothetical protein